ncbi:MAG: LacI family DNA-binding transcriptional regulator [Eubacteriales bacterium]|nr:LacI family DNA-binding transcriptional regulator [Eubacteriales bacterium]MDD3881198.1 LacI family DNA-binding transcriptional regulator [Eubacteriales bacterium]MDD4511580.1 LacI family DNA-binding transcriptional regulator [Eubacteriales bacterium]
MKSVSMRDIGKELGVSAVTVSKALAGRSGVSDEMREKIVKRAEEMGYRYDLSAHPVGVERKDVGILVPDRFMEPGTSFYASMCKKLVAQLAARRSSGMLEILSDSEERRLVFPSVLSLERIGGLIILGQLSREYMQMLERSNLKVPYICLDFYDERSDADSIVSDGVYGTYRLTSHLIHMGHTRIGFLGSIKATSSIMDRYLGYYRSMLSHDLPINEDWIMPDRNEKGELIPAVLPEGGLTAVVCNCDRVAASLIRQLGKSGLKVPEDVSVVGFDNYYEYPCEPALTTYAVDQDMMARTAAEQIEGKMRGIPVRGGRIVTVGKIVYRDSVKDLKPARAR